MAVSNGSDNRPSDVDAVVVGAGFAGLYLMYRLRKLGLSTRGFEAAADVGGTWYWNRYPGARCDIPTTDYTYSFDPELESGVDLVGEVRHPAGDPAPTCSTSPTATTCAATSSSRPGSSRPTGTRTAHRWRLRTEGGEEISCQFYVMATGCLSQPKTPDIEGTERFQGEVYFTSTLAPRRGGLHRQAGGRDRYRARRASSPSRSSPPRPPSSRSSSGPPTSRSRPTTGRCPPERMAAARPPTGTPTARRPAWSRGGVPVETTEHHRGCGLRGGATARASRRPGRPASCSPSSACSADQIVNRGVQRRSSPR